MFKLACPISHSLYVRTYIYDTLDEMRAAADAENHRFPPESWARRRAYCASFHRRVRDKHGRLRSDPCVAEVRFARPYLSLEIVVHELFHATVTWGHRWGLDFTSLRADTTTRTEEMLAYTHGCLVSEFARRAGIPLTTEQSDGSY